MAEFVRVPEADWQDILDATRAKTGGTEKMVSGEVAAKVRSIETEPILEELTITENGEYIPDEGVDGFSKVSVEVSGGEQDIYSNEKVLALLNRSITEWTIPDGVTSIGYSAFRGCVSLKNITIPDSVTIIENSAFEVCYKLDLTTLPEGITRLADGSATIPLIKLPDALTTIGAAVFQYSNGLAITEIPAGVTSIGKNAFRQCDDITELTIKCSANIQTNTFYNCQGLKYVKFEGTPETISALAFYGCISLAEVTFCGTPNEIASSCFNNCAALTTINVPWAEGAVANAPWGATNATINYNYVEEG